jgi:hypothetical protein
MTQEGQRVLLASDLACRGLDVPGEPSYIVYSLLHDTYHTAAESDVIPQPPYAWDLACRDLHVPRDLLCFMSHVSYK